MVLRRQEVGEFCPKCKWALYPHVLNNGMVYLNADTTDAAGCRRQRPNWTQPLEPERWMLDEYPEIVDFLENNHTAQALSQSYYPPELLIYPSAQYNPKFILGPLGEALEAAGVTLQVLREDVKLDAWVQWWVLRDANWRLKQACLTVPMYFHQTKMIDGFPDQLEELRSTSNGIVLRLLEDEDFAVMCLRQQRARQRRGFLQRLKEFFD